MPPVRTLPIFPLDGVYLCPGLLLPLHIFEPRYRAMLTHALEGERCIAMCLPALGHSTESESAPPVHEICGLGEIVEHHPFPDGRANILLRGCSRLRIYEELPLTADGYRLVRAEVLPEEQPGDVDLTAELVELTDALARTGVSDAGALAELSTQQLVDSTVVALPLPPALKLELFSELNVEKRLRRLIENLPGTLRPDLDIRPGDPRLN